MLPVFVDFPTYAEALRVARQHAESGRFDNFLVLCRQITELLPDYRANAQGEADAVVTPHELYPGLGWEAGFRQVAYRELFRHELEPGLVDQIRQATNGNFALGTPRFTDEIAAVLGRRARPGKSGRPRKVAEPVSGDLF